MWPIKNGSQLLNGISLGLSIVFDLFYSTVVISLFNQQDFIGRNIGDDWQIYDILMALALCYIIITFFPTFLINTAIIVLSFTKFPEFKQNDYYAE